MRDTVEQFRALDTEPFGINQADAESHRRFIEKLNLPFDLLVDEGFHVSDLYDAIKTEGTAVKRKLDRINRTVVIVGKNGRIIYRAAGAPPPTELLAAIEQANDEPNGDETGG